MYHILTLDERVFPQFGNAFDYVTAYQMICSCGWDGEWHAAEDESLRALKLQF